MITGVANVIGRFTAPALSDAIGVKRVFYILFALMFVSSLSMIFAQGMLFIVVIALISYTYGGWTGIIPVITVELFGAKHFQSNYGMVMITPAIAGLVFPVAAGALSNSDMPSLFSFAVPALACVIGFIVSTRINFPKRSEPALPESLQELAQNN
jgi:OFA family oxalate/formate antiporter-like MFS transporter